MVRVTVLKSLRTHTGAEDWLRTMKHQFPTAKVMGTEVLKTFPDVAYTVDPVGFNSHVVIEEDLTPVIEAVSAGEFGELLSTFIEKGYAKVDQYGFCFTEKWNDAISRFLGEAFERGIDSYKSTAKVQRDAGLEELLGVFDRVVLKGGEPEDVKETIPDSDISADNPEPEDISDEKAQAAIHTEGTLPEGWEPLDAENLSDVLKGKVFKSMAEAKEWENPDESRYFIDGMSFHEKKEHGRRFNYIVRERAPKEEIGAMGNRKTR